MPRPKKPSEPSDAHTLGLKKMVVTQISKAHPWRQSPLVLSQRLLTYRLLANNDLEPESSA